MDTSTEEPTFDPSAEDVQPQPPGTPPVPAKTEVDDKPNTAAVEDNESIGTSIVKGIGHGAEDATNAIKSRFGLGDGTSDKKLSDLVAPKPEEKRSVVDDAVADITRIALGAGVAGVAIAGGVAAAGVAVPAAAVTVGGILLGSALTGVPTKDNPLNHLSEYPWLSFLSPLASKPTDNETLAMVKLHATDLLGLKVGEKLVNAAQLTYLKMAGKGATPQAVKLEKEVAKTSFDKGTPITEADGPLHAASQKMNKDEAAYKAEQAAYHGDDPAAAGPISAARYQAAKGSARPEVSTNGKPLAADAPRKIEDIKVQNKAILQKQFADKATEYAHRGASEDEVRKVITNGRMELGRNAEGQAVTAAEKIHSNGMAMYGSDGWGIVAPKKTWEKYDTGHAGEVHIDPSANPRDMHFIDPQGNVHSFDEAKAVLSASKSDANVVKPVGPPITLKSSEGEPLVTLTPRKQAKFEQTMEELIIKNHVEGTPRPAGGPMSKEGSMNTDHMDSEHIVLQGLKDLGSLTKTELGTKMPTERTWAETERLGKIMGSDPDQLIASLKTFNHSAEDIDAIAVGARMYIQTKGAEMISAGRKAFISGDEVAKAQFDELYMNLAEVQAHLSSATNRLGRGLSSFNINAKPFDIAATKKMLENPVESEKLQRLMAATGGDPEQIAHILKMQQLSWLEKAVGTHNEYWTGLGLLSRAATQTINLGSTGIQALMEPASMLVGGVAQGMTGKGWESAREAVGIYSGMRTAVFDSLHMAWQAAKTEKAILSQNGTMEQKTQYISSLTYNMNPDSFGGKFIDLMGNVTRASFRGLTAGDEFFKQLSYRAKISATASREAVDLVKAGQLKDSEVADHVAKALQASIDDAGRATNADALKYAEKASFVNDLKGDTWNDWTSIGEHMAQLGGHPVIRGVILPFVKTPTNVTRTTFEYTPLIGQLRKQFYADVKAGGQKQAQAIGKLTIGAGMYTGAAYLALEGRITGAPPAPGVPVPPGFKPYAVVFRGMGDNGGDLYVSYQRMQPFGDVLGLTYDFAKSTGMMDNDTREGMAQSMSLALTKFMEHPWEQGSSAGVAVGAAYGKSLISKTYFRNMTEFFSTFSGYNNENAMLRWLQNYGASHVPGALAQFNSDDTIREVRSALDAFMARTPGLSQMLPAKRDYFGRIQDVKVGWPYSIVQPFGASQTKPDPVMHEIYRLGQSNAQAKFSEMSNQYTIAGKAVDLKSIKNDAGVTAYDRMNELMQTVKPVGHSKTFHDELQATMNGPRYQLGKESDTLDGTPGTIGFRVQQVKALEYAYRAAALDKVKDEYKTQLGIESALKDKINTKVGKAKVGAGLYDKILDITK